MDDQLQLELRTLRVRAYGPTSDIHDDPEALARLHDLERLARGPETRQLPPKPPLPQGGEPAIAVEPLVSAEAPADDDVAVRSVEEDSLTDDSGASQPPAGKAGQVGESAKAGTWSKKRIAVTWLASLAVAILVTATVTGFVSRRIQADPHEVAVLGVDAFAEWPSIFGSYTEDGELEVGTPDGGMAFESFHGVALFRMPNGIFSYGGDQPCLMVAEVDKIDSDSNSYDGLIFNGCAAGTFPATVEIVVTRGPQDLPEELLEAFPEGTGMQFVLDGDEVVVLSDQD